MVAVHIEKCPSMYEMFWRPETFSIEIRMRHEVMHGIPGKPVQWPLVHVLQKSGEVRGFSADYKKGFGFADGMLVRVPDPAPEKYARFAVELPVIRKVLGKCQECRPKTREGCNYCHGSGEKFVYHHGLLKPIVLSLYLMLEGLLMVDNRPETDREQLVTPELLIVRREMHCYPLYGSVSHTMARYLHSLGENVRIESSEAAMRTVLDHFFTKDVGGKIFSYRAEVVNDGRFSMRVPGDCSCIGSECGFRINETWPRGYQFDSHNVDTAPQQLSLMVGVIVMWEQARLALYGSIAED